MDVRINRTNEKILSTFKELLKEKEFSKITIEDILEKADIARSTFYKHYKTKNELLVAEINKIFIHVFNHALKEEKSHDFSKSSILDYKHYISHILYHLHEEKDMLHALLNSTIRQFFIRTLMNEFKPFAINCIENNFLSNNNVPKELFLSDIVTSFILVIDYWDQTNFKDTPETLTEYFINLNK